MAPSFNNRRIALAFRLFFLLSVFLHLSWTFAQDSLLQSAKEDFAGSVDLGRRGKMSLNDLENNSILSLGLDSTGPGLFDAFFASLSMIIVSEIGDETFIIAALMAMRHPKSIVLSGALSALVIMTPLGFPLILDFLYAFFGLRLLYIAWRSTDSKSSQKKEMEESFILTFLAEWGDRSQIATIALATHKNALGVAVGATIGHTICTSLAVVGGSMLASRISQRSVATVGGVLFLGFSISSYFYPPL
ncbi:hypothetical protein Fmac_017767 [Flemingia macrophylla]|uniref:GDT1 family protein n=1 Tax=Flemingia macrophylla TaxID=520843 RepID=A0ABD1M365_9FABA